MKRVFLESHNIKNLFFGFGQFNYQLVKALHKAAVSDFKMVLHAKNDSKLKSEFGKYFEYKPYFGFRRYPLFRIRQQYALWHSLNQNTKIEPASNSPYLLTVHDVNFVEEASVSKASETRQRFQEKLDRSDAITYISEFAKKSTHQNFKVPEVPEYVIYNGNPIQTIEISESYTPKKTSSRPFLFSIGEFTARKNFHTLIEMLALLPDYDLILSGKNTTAYTQEVLKPLISKLNLENRVHITGKIEDLDKQYYLKNCSAFLFPSLREGFGIPPIEAMRSGKPVFLSNTTSLPEIGGPDAFYWDHYNPSYMVDIFKKGMQKYTNDKASMSERYIKRAKSFCWDKAASEYLKVYRSLL